jgi:hypothetical protein
MSAAGLAAAAASGPTGAEVTITLNALETYCLDEWIERHEEPRPSRSEAIRRLMRIGLNGHPGQ